MWTVRQNNNRKETTGIWLRQRTEQIAFFSAEDKGPLSRRACHCAGGTAAATPDTRPHFCRACTTARACTASALTDGRQVAPLKSNMVSSHRLSCGNRHRFKYLNAPKRTSYVHKAPVSPTVLESITRGGFSKTYSISAAQFQSPSPVNLGHLSFLQRISAELTPQKTSSR